VHAVEIGATFDLDRPGVLVDLAMQPLVHDEEAHDVLNFGYGDFEPLGDEVQAEARVRRHQFDHRLGAHVAGDFVDVLRDKGICKEVLVLLQNSLVLMNVIPLVCIYQFRHSGDSRIILIWLGLLRVKGIDVRAHQHRRQHEVLQHLDALQRPRLIIVPEGFEEVALCILPVLCSHRSANANACSESLARAKRTFAHVHLSTAFADDAHDLGVWHG
jgi:hypothetical protein